MKVPILMNGREVVRSWKTESAAIPEVKEAGYGQLLDLSTVDHLIAELVALTKSLPATDDGRREFDQRVSGLLGEQLRLSPSLAADKRFWQWLSITRAQEIVLWRWKKQRRESVTEDRWLGGWKDTFRRLWMRANIVRQDGDEQPFALAGRGDEDFWVGIIERDISACREVVRSLVRRFFEAEDTGSSQRMLHYRETLKRLRQIRPNRVYECMTTTEICTLVEDAVAATVPASAKGSRKPRSANRTAKKRSSRRPVR